MLLPSPRALSGHLRTSPRLVVPNVLVSGQDAKRMRQHNCGVGQVMPITIHSGSPCRGVEAWVATLVNPAASIYAPTRRCWSGPDSDCQIATALVGKHRLENDTTNGEPGRSTRQTSR